MMMAGPTPSSDISPVTRGSPETSNGIWEILATIQTQPMTVDTAAKL